MAKTAKLKKKQAAPHSRAARRAASPSIPLASAPRTRSTSPQPSTAKPHILSAQSSRVSKRKSTKTTRAQRVRAEKAMERAADDMDKWEKKKAKSLDKARGIKDRAKVWEEVNGESGRAVRGKAKGGEEEGLDGLEGLEGRGKSVWVDVDEGEGEGEGAGVDGVDEVPVVEDEML
ncbi:uncharacterized protein M421DRAFT_10209 [Didymella exigua CBS 183.55]|uniref:Alb1-domain-containing protein n=1 Tax=Didymella exigua CBS 183.55 TaxID=1150837 RepID=A0A6A5RAL6_9PLEO|nr:uncharacterized protein M421DRAFT_10209 [Didymella exigua CBS 183.55]KAF1922857.1 hypothetical protein M421DRAFT_10209 [Didymella exigua CBS 183.55]